MTKGKLTGAVLATAVALIFAGNAAYAADSSDSSAAASQVKCVGGNACKGKGYVMTPTAKECVAAGGKPQTVTKSD